MFHCGLLEYLAKVIALWKHENVSENPLSQFLFSS